MKPAPNKEINTAAKRKKLLVLTCAITGAVILFNLFCLFFYLPRTLTERLFGHFLITCVMSLVIFFVGRFISGAVLRDRGYSSGQVEGGSASARKNVRFILTVALAVAAEMVLIQRLNPSYGNPMLFDLIFYMVFFVCGLMLARDQDSDHAPVLFALIVVLALSLIQFAMFLRDPTAAARYGPERVIVGLRNFIVRTDMLPLEIAITWAAWRVSRVNRLRPIGSGRT